MYINIYRVHEHEGARNQKQKNRPQRKKDAMHTNRKEKSQKRGGRKLKKEERNSGPGRGKEHAVIALNKKGLGGTHQGSSLAPGRKNDQGRLGILIEKGGHTNPSHSVRKRDQLLKIRPLPKGQRRSWTGDIGGTGVNPKKGAPGGGRVERRTLNVPRGGGWGKHATYKSELLASTKAHCFEKGGGTKKSSILEEGAPKKVRLERKRWERQWLR